MAEINERIISSQPETVRSKLRDLRKLVESRFKEFRTFLHRDPIAAKAALARNLPHIVLKPGIRPDGRKFFMVTSEWELLEGGVALLDGAEGQS